MKRKLLIVTIAGGLLVAPASTATANGDPGGCAAFGVHVSTDAHVLQPSGRLVSQFARAGFIDEHVHADHAALC
jgi:hypothetical protein